MCEYLCVYEEMDRAIYRFSATSSLFLKKKNWKCSHVEKGFMFSTSRIVLKKLICAFSSFRISMARSLFISETINTSKKISMSRKKTMAIFFLFKSLFFVRKKVESKKNSLCLNYAWKQNLKREPRSSALNPRVSRWW